MQYDVVVLVMRHHTTATATMPTKVEWFITVITQCVRCAQMLTVS